jgi:hypothetical protein
MDLAARPSSAGMTLKMLWRSRVKRIRDNQINFFTLSSGGKECAVKYYLQDPFCNVVQKGSEWVNTIEIPEGNLKGATQFGVMLCDKKGAISCRAGRKDVSSTKVLIPIIDSVNNWNAFEKSYRLLPTSWVQSKRCIV